MIEMPSTPFTNKLTNIKPAGINQWLASCPCSTNHKNGDKNQSLSVGYDPTSGSILIYCQTGCDYKKVLSAAGCTVADLSTHEKKNNIFGFASWLANKNGITLADIYDYKNGLFKVKFYDANKEKTFKWIHTDTTKQSGFAMGKGGAKHRLYIAGDISADTAIITEGEKDANTVHRITDITAVSSENGATTGSATKKWCPEYTATLTGKDVYILSDNDPAGEHFAQIEADALHGKAKSVKLIDIKKIWPGCPEKADISDYLETFGSEATKERIKYGMKTATEYTASVKPEQAEPPAKRPTDEDEKPAWLIESEYNGRTTIKLNEPMFCKMFIEEHKAARINDTFYLNGKKVHDNQILNMIQSKLQPYFVERTGRKTNDVFISLQNAAYVEQPQPDESKIFCAGNVTITIDGSGNIDTHEEDIFTLTRLAVPYHQNAACPTFLSYINDLLYPEDIPALQEYMGYMLIPSTRAQAGLYIHGQGGEGKSILRDVVMTMFGDAAAQERLHELSNNRFVLANLENKLVFVDDELRSDLLTDTSTIKQITTNTPTKPTPVEKKNKQKYPTFIYSRIFALGNSFIGSKFDHSDGFYRRQLLIDCKPKTRLEAEDDRFMSEKVCKEVDGIFIWCLSGLVRLIQNGFHFSVSDRMKRTLDDVKHEGDNSLTFFEDDSVITIDNDDWTGGTTSADLWAAYALWCFDNAETPIKKGSFNRKTAERFKIYKCRIIINGSRLQGFRNIILSDSMQKRLQTLDEKTTDRVKRLP